MRDIERDFTLELRDRLLEEDLHFIQVVMGPRQVGKTTGVKQIHDSWKSPSLMVTADEVTSPSMDWIRLHWHQARQMGKNTLLVIDEIQKIPDWSGVVKHLYDQDRRNKNLKVVLLGSASLSLQKGLSESLAGRFEITPAPHWTFAECRKAFGWNLDQFLKFGGYPAGARLTHSISRWQSFVRNSIIEPVLIKDILGLSPVGKPALFRQTFELCMSYPAQEVSLQKILGQMQDKGNVTTIKHYLELLEGAFLLKTLQKYTGSKISQKGSSPKILPLNTALIHAFRSPKDFDSDPDWRGRVFEMAVGAMLSQSGGQLFYWREGKFEVDFVLKHHGKLYAIEVKSGRARFSNGLMAFHRQYPSSIPVTIDREKAKKLLESKEVDALFEDKRFLFS